MAVVAADSLLGIQDFRADEKAMQTLEQFRGRCGRRESKGLFVIQTSQPEHPVYQKIANNDTISLSTNLLQERKDFNFPPYTRIIEISVKDSFEDRAARMAERLGERIRQAFSTSVRSVMDDPVTGPYSPAVDKVADQYIRIIRLSLKKDRRLIERKNELKRIVGVFEKEQRYEGHIILNVDPS